MKQTALLHEEIFPPFEGFPREGIGFLKRLKKNNNRTWFQKHREEYEHLVKFPMQCLIASLAERMRDIAPEFEFSPRKSIFRIHRDVRFSKNKAPYKTNIAASFHMRGDQGRTTSPSFYVGIEPGEIWVGGGMYIPTGDQLKKIRQEMAERPSDFLEVVENTRFKREFGGIDGEKLQKAPVGFPKDHPMVEHLKHKQFYAGKTLDDSACLSPKFLDMVVRTYVDVLPLVRWLARAVG